MWACERQKENGGERERNSANQQFKLHICFKMFCFVVPLVRAFTETSMLVPIEVEKPAHYINNGSNSGKPEARTETF